MTLRVPQGEREYMELFKSYRFWLGIALLGFIVGMRYSGIASFVTVEYLQAQRIYLESFVELHYVGSVISFIGIYIFLVVLGLPLAALLTVTGGFLFGIIPGTLYANIGATIGSIIFFLMVRNSLGFAIQKKYQQQLVWFNAQFKKYGKSYLIAIRFMALIPFFIQNILIGLTKVPLKTFIWTTSVGILPASFVFAYAGRELATISSIKDIFSWHVLLAFMLLALIAIIPIFIQRRKNK